MVLENEMLNRYNLGGETRPSRFPLVTPLITLVRRRYTVLAPGTLALSVLRRAQLMPLVSGKQAKSINAG